MDLYSDIEHKVIISEGKRYEFVQLEEPIDLSPQNNGVKTMGTHVLLGFPEKLLLIIEEPPPGFDSAVYFGHIIGDTGLVVNLEDQDIYLKAIEILAQVLGRR